MMNLFKKKLSKKKLHKNFLEIQRSSQKQDRLHLQNLAQGFPDRDNKFVHEFQTTFNSSFWELYLYALFNELKIEMNWDHASPDFFLNTDYGEFVVEAVIASNTQGKIPEWERDLASLPIDQPIKFREMNCESIIRLSNAIRSKSKRYREHYRNLYHVKDNPFVLAIAPFEQPYFNLQYDVPITALLFDYYVDEDAYNENPLIYPEGPPGISLGSVKKDNGSPIDLGIFRNNQLSEISAIIFSTTATWGKIEATSKNTNILRFISSVWFDKHTKTPTLRQLPAIEHFETIRDGLMVFHNPYADHPLSNDLFDCDGVVQIFWDINSQQVIRKRNGNCLINRQTINLSYQ